MPVPVPPETTMFTRPRTALPRRSTCAGVSVPRSTRSAIVERLAREPPDGEQRPVERQRRRGRRSRGCRRAGGRRPSGSRRPPAGRRRRRRARSPDAGARRRGTARPRARASRRARRTPTAGPFAITSVTAGSRISGSSGPSPTASSTTSSTRRSRSMTGRIDAVAHEQVSQPGGDDRAQLSRIRSRRQHGHLLAHANPVPMRHGVERVHPRAPSASAASAAGGPVRVQRSRSSCPSRMPDIDRRSSRTTAATGASTILEIARNPISARRDQRFTTIPGSAARSPPRASRTSERAASSDARSGVTTTSTRSAATSASRGAADTAHPTSITESRSRARSSRTSSEPHPGVRMPRRSGSGGPATMAQARPGARSTMVPMPEASASPAWARSASDLSGRAPRANARPARLPARSTSSAFAVAASPRATALAPTPPRAPDDRDHPTLPHVGRRAACPAHAQGVGHGGGQPWRG